jgi:hypothetical protein
MLRIPIRWRAAMGMTQQYVVGELSLLLARLQATADSDESVERVAQLRREAESRPPWRLHDVEVRALAPADGLCWTSLVRGDSAAFDRQATVGSQLVEFGVCSGLLPARYPCDPNPANQSNGVPRSEA